MKKIIVIFSLMLFALSSFAQWEASRDAGYDYFDPDTERYMTYYTGVASDTIGTGDSTLTKTILINTDQALKYEVYVSLDSTGGTADSVTVTLNTKTDVDESYTTRETQGYNGTADTTFRFTEVTTGVPDRYWQIKLVGQSDNFKCKISYLNFRWYK